LLVEPLGVAVHGRAVEGRCDTKLKREVPQQQFFKGHNYYDNKIYMALHECAVAAVHSANLLKYLHHLTELVWLNCIRPQ
jgi:hypothetical protein